MLMDKTYEPNWHHELIANKLMEVADNKCKRLIIQMPPRHGKSRLVSELFPAWVLGRQAYKEIMIGSYSESLAKEFGMRARACAEEDVFKVVFNTSVRKDRRSAGDWALVGAAGGRGGYRAVGLNGSITGKGADIFIVDDPIRNRQDADSKLVRDTIWNNFSSAVQTRLTPESAVIIVLTTWHLDDIIGRIRQNLKERGIKLEDEWDVLCLPALADKDEEWDVNGEIITRGKGDALWEEHFPRTFLENKKLDIGVVEFSSLYQQNPITAETQVFTKDRFIYRSEAQVQGLKSRRFLTIDPAVGTGSKNDFTGFCDNRVDSQGFWNIRGWHKKISPRELIETLFTLQYTHFYERIGIEQGVYQMAIEPFLREEMLRRNAFLPIMVLKSLQRSKISRIGDLESRYEAGKIFHIEGQCADMEEEYLTYPKGIHDDIIDAVAYQIQITENASEDEGKFPEQELFDEDGFY